MNAGLVKTTFILSLFKNKTKIGLCAWPHGAFKDWALI